MEIVDNTEDEQFEIRVDGVLAGRAEYQSKRGIIAFMHTEIEPGYQGQGLAGKLIAFALEHSRDADMAVLPFCEYVAGHIVKHPQFLTLVPDQLRANFDLPAA